MKAAFMYGPRDLRVEEVEAPTTLQPDEVLVRIRVVSICGSDVDLYQSGKVGPFVVEKPFILGHECSGEVVEVGEEVKGLREKDRVAIEPGVPCRRCSYCKEGRYNLCEDVRFMATPPVDGALREYVAWPSDFAHKIPDDMAYSTGAMIEPTANSMAAVIRGGVKEGNSVAILGAGPMGLLSLQAARVRGATDIYVADRNDYKLELAGRLGASNVINTKEENPTEAVMELTRQEGVDVTIEATGAPDIIRQTPNMTRRGGVVVLVGIHGEPTPVNGMEVLFKGLDVRGLFRYANLFPAAIKLVASGRIDVDSLITHHFPLDEVGRAFEIADRKLEKRIAIEIEV